MKKSAQTTTAAPLPSHSLKEGAEKKKEESGGEVQDLFSIESCVMGDTVSFAYRNFGEIPLDILNHPFCPFIKTLDLTETNIKSLAPIASFESLATLILDKSPHCQIETSPVLPKLETLSCNNNEIEDIVSFMDTVKAKFPHLQFLSMMRNPCNSTLLGSFVEPDIEANRLFRLYVLYRMPGLVTIDCGAVTDEEVSEAERRGQYAVIRKNSAASSTNTDDYAAAAAAADGGTIFSSVASAAQVVARSVSKLRLSDDKAGPYSREPNSEGNRFIRNTEL